MRAACALRFAVLLTVPLLLNACAATKTVSEGGTTTVYFLRHAEQDPKDPDRPLTDRGRARAGSLVVHLAAVPITHVYASHTDRTRAKMLRREKLRQDLDLELAERQPDKSESHQLW